MTSTKNLQELIQDRDKGSKMTSIKHDDQAAPATSSEGQPPLPPGHQQDLIRLLAQHFNSQLYQMTAANNQRLPDVNPGNQLLHNFSNSAAGGALSFQSPLILSQYQQQQRQFRGQLNHGPTNNLLSHLDQPTGLANHVSRSHHQTSSSSASSGPSSHHHHPHGQQHDATLPMSTAASNPLACNPLFGDANMNLFNALNCFNVTSDQFLLSLQQQYLLQAASTVRQMESRQIISNNEEMNRIVEANAQNHAARTIAGKAELASGGGRTGVTDLSGVENNSGKELLKFSINTILGRGSPAQNSAVNSDIKTNAGNASGPRNQYLIQRASGGAYLSRENESANMTTPDCDQELNTTDIDSCSSLTTTPQPGVANQTNDPFGQLAGHQPSSSSSTNNNQSGDLAMDMNKQHPSGQHQTTLSFLSGSSTFPWTVAARGKPRRGMMRRAVFSDSQRVGLEKRFQLQKYISKPDRKKLAEKLGLRDSQVKIWFQNRRMKWRNSKERELLSAGGSREQTLPTRNNPNPDLSDVGETIKRIVSGSNSIGAA